MLRYFNINLTISVWAQDFVGLVARNFLFLETLHCTIMKINPFDSHHKRNYRGIIVRLIV